ncbi:cell envelope integrity protein TolA [Mesorhizobium sp. CCNWLY176]
MKLANQIFLALLLCLVGISSNAQAQDSAVSDLVSALRGEVQRCWAPPMLTGKRPRPAVISVRLNPDGSLDGIPVLANRSSNENFKVMATSAIRAIERCAPFESVRQQHVPYDKWRQLKLRFVAPEF